MQSFLDSLDGTHNFSTIQSIDCEFQYHAFPIQARPVLELQADKSPADIGSQDQLNIALAIKHELNIGS